jgi:hypothetical protein
MYEVDARDSVQQLTQVPQPDVGAPLPVIVADEYKLLLAYIIVQPHPDWDGTSVTVVSDNTADEPIAILRFERPTAHFMGPPNDEALRGHPLASRGLRPYSVFEVHDSSWIRKLERMNSVHPHHQTERYLAHKKHFIFAFHDSTFECVAHGFEIDSFRGSIVQARQRMAEMLHK